MNGLRSTIGIYGFHELKLRPFLNMLITPKFKIPQQAKTSHLKSDFTFFETSARLSQLAHDVRKERNEREGGMNGRSKNECTIEEGIYNLQFFFGEKIILV